MGDISVDELEIKIRDIFFSGRIIYSKYVKKRMKERSYTIGDVRHIIQFGRISNFTEEKPNQFKCEIHGRSIEGHEGAVIVLIIKDAKLIIKTVLGGV